MGFAVLWGFLLFAEVPANLVIIGMVMIIAAGIISGRQAVASPQTNSLGERLSVQRDRADRWQRSAPAQGCSLRDIRDRAGFDDSSFTFSRAVFLDRNQDQFGCY